MMFLFNIEACQNIESPMKKPIRAHEGTGEG